MLNVPQHMSAGSTKNPQCHGVDRRDAKGLLGLEGVVDSGHKREATFMTPIQCGSARGPHQIQPYSVASRSLGSLELNSESL